MQRLTVSLLSLVASLCLPLTAEAVITVNFGNYMMGQGDSITVPISISTNASEEISAVDLYLQVEDGSSFFDGPYASAMNLAQPGLPTTIFDAVSSTEAAYGDPWNVENGTSTGLKPAYAVFTNATSGPNADVPANGVLAYVQFDTLPSAIPGLYHVSFTSDDLGDTLMAKTSGLLNLGSQYFLVDGTIHVTPEPSSIVLGLLATAALGAVSIRRRRARRAA